MVHNILVQLFYQVFVQHFTWRKMYIPYLRNYISSIGQKLTENGSYFFVFKLLVFFYVAHIFFCVSALIFSLF